MMSIQQVTLSLAGGGAAVVGALVGADVVDVAFFLSVSTQRVREEEETKMQQKSLSAGHDTLQRR